MARKPLSRSSNKKLTKKQKTTVTENLSRRIDTLRQQNALEATVISHMGYTVIVQTAPETPFIACDWRQNIGTICAGDQVLITEHNTPESEQQSHRIEAVLPRTSVIEKQNVYRGAKAFAANIDQILIIVTHEPMFQPSLLDRYIIMASVVGIDCLVYFNKTDILTDAETIAHVDSMRHIYEAIPHVTWVKGSLKSKDGLHDLYRQLNNRRTVITGQSGVGKSTLINALIPDMNIQTMSISSASGLGRHSTTNSTLYRLDKHTMNSAILIDTPGVRSFDTYHLSTEDIEKGFAEIEPFLGYCQFSNCSHTHEKRCAIKNAIASGDISEMRYNSFLQILKEAQAYDNS